MTITGSPRTRSRAQGSTDAPTGRGRHGAGSSGAAPVRRLPRPRPARTRTSDVLALGGFVVVVTAGLWVRHGGLGLLREGGVGTLSGLGQLSGLVAALAALGGVVVAARPRSLERRYGQDRLIAGHRWFGIVTMLALLVHVVTDTWAWGASTGGTFVSGLVDLVAHESWMVAAAAGTVLFFVIGLSSWRRLRRRIPYETWYFVHLTAYLAVLLGFGHQLTLGSDFAADTLAWWWWVGLFAATFAFVTWVRTADLLRSLTRTFRVTAVSREANGIGSLHVAGPGLHKMRVASGQFFNVRVLTRDLWWQAHPYSVSAAPTTAGLRFTVKEFGEDSTRLLGVRPGTRVLLEGPYGTFTVDQAAGKPVVLVAGGVGVAPIRALLEDCRPEQCPVVIVRVRDEADVAHRIELERMVASRNGVLHVLAGPREWFGRVDPFAAQTLRAWIPDVRERHVFVCGPASLEHAVMTGMRKAGVPAAQIHHERFGV
ncbi:MAG: ferredoxin reductase family protein [Candidatus Nanopelagicales bacterium]